MNYRFSVVSSHKKHHLRPAEGVAADLGGSERLVDITGARGGTRGRYVSDYA